MALDYATKNNAARYSRRRMYVNDGSKGRGTRLRMNESRGLDTPRSVCGTTTCLQQPISSFVCILSISVKIGPNQSQRDVTVTHN